MFQVCYTMKSFTRQELLQALSVMDISILPKAKFPNGVLEKHLGQALNVSQMISKIVIRLPFNINALSEWPSSSSYFKAVMQGDFQEAGIFSSNTLYLNTFIDLRQTVLTVAHGWDKRFKLFIMQKDTKKCAINIRVCTNFFECPHRWCASHFLLQCVS